MGKGGRGKAKAAAAAPEDDDALLEAAMATAKAERAQAAEEQQRKAKEAAEAAKAAMASAEGTKLTMPQTLAKLDRVMTFTITRLMPDGMKDACPSPSGAVTFYTDHEDVKADLAELQKADASAKLAIDFTPLGRAFALTQGIGGIKTPGPTKLQFSRATVAKFGNEGVPEPLRESMASTGPFPLFYSDKLGSVQFTPVFFSVSDLREFWVTCGGDPKKAPKPTVTDLRIVVARTLQEPGSWEPLHYVPMKASEPLMRELSARAEREEEHRKGFAAGAERLKAVSKAVATADGDEPPVLV